MACGIYKITNLVTNKVYIGQSIDIKRRWRCERSAAFNERSKSYDTVLSKAFRKYCNITAEKVDFSNFVFEILEECSVEVLDEREQYYITKFNSYIDGYNMTEGGANPHTQLLTKEQILNIITSLQNDLTKNTEQLGKEFGVSGRMIRNINNGSCHRQANISYPIRPLFVSHPRNITLRNTAQGITTIEETPLKISKRPELSILFKQIYETSFTAVGKLYGVSSTMVQKWLKNTQAPSKIKEFKQWYKTEILKEPLVVKEKSNKSMPKRVKQFTLTGEFLQEFSSLNQAANAVTSNNFGSVHIREVCEGKRKSAYGYYWQFA